MPKNIKPAIQEQIRKRCNEYVGSGKLIQDIIVFGKEERNTEKVRLIKLIEEHYNAFQQKMHRPPRNMEEIIQNLVLKGKARRELEEALTKLSEMKNQQNTNI